jgi:MoaA/NifB/PqqE/SkfB family radical SAM enzyme
MPDKDQLNTEDSKRLIEVIRTGTPAIYWCGGEPTMRNDLPELLDHACELGFYPNMINTNGSLLYQRLQKPEWSKFLWQMDIIIVSLDGLNLEMLNGLWGVKKAKQVIINLLMLRELRKDVKYKLAVNAVITLQNIKEAEAVLNFANDLDLWFAPVPVNFMHEPNQQLLDNPDYQKLVNLILQRKKQGYKIIGSEHLLKQLLLAESYQCETTLKPHIWPDGSICFPCRASVNIKPVNINLLEHGTFDEAYEAGRKLINPDNFHGLGTEQCGGNCAWMQNYTTARYVEGLMHPVRSGIFSEIKEFAG